VKLTYTGDPDGLDTLLNALRRQGLDPHEVPAEDEDAIDTVLWLAGSPTADDPAERAVWATAREVAAKVRARVPNIRIDVEETDE